MVFLPHIKELSTALIGLSTVDTDASVEFLGQEIPPKMENGVRITQDGLIVSGLWI